MMGDIGILFRPEMVRAQLEGRKTQTRRPAWRVVEVPPDQMPGSALNDAPGATSYEKWYPTRWQSVKPGDRLWCRESFYFDDNGHDETIVYAADHGAAEKHLAEIDALGAQFPQDTANRLRKLRPGIHMPRWASRLTWVVTAVKIERLQDISEADAIAEGIYERASNRSSFVQSVWSWRPHGDGWPRPQAAYSALYREIHGGGAWDANPEVVAVTGVVHKANIDQLPAQVAA